MKKAVSTSSMLVLTLTMLVSAQNSQTSADKLEHEWGINCSGTAKQCAKPAKFLSKTPECVCFTCGYGKPDSIAICTKNVKEAQSLAKIAQESGFADVGMGVAVAALAQKNNSQHQYVEANRRSDDDKSKDKF